MTVTLTFNLPEENSELMTYLKVYDYHSALEGFRNYLRRQNKSGLNPPVDEIQEEFYKLVGGLLD